MKKILVLGCAGRVGMQIASELLRVGRDLVLVDIVPQRRLEQMVGRLLGDARLAVGRHAGRCKIYGDVDALDRDQVAAILAAESPALVINYAIPITWDATKRLSNYSRISAAGLGAFTPVQALTPLKVGEAIVQSGIETKYMVGNLPDITIPLIRGIALGGSVAAPLCGAGNVGLNEIAMRRQVALECDANIEDIELSLVSHHVHWVAPREPGYSNEAPFMAKVVVAGEDVSERLGDLRALMNRGVQNHYESDASFSSTTGILASQVGLALLDEGGESHRLHAPAPNGLPGGYPVRIVDGAISVDLPRQWSMDTAVQAMEHCHTLDGVQEIASDGAVAFTDGAQGILREEMDFELPAKMPAADVEEVARAQIGALTRLFEIR